MYVLDTQFANLFFAFAIYYNVFLAYFYTNLANTRKKVNILKYYSSSNISLFGKLELLKSFIVYKLPIQYCNCSNIDWMYILDLKYQYSDWRPFSCIHFESSFLFDPLIFLQTLISKERIMIASLSCNTLIELPLVLCILTRHENTFD